LCKRFCAGDPMKFIMEKIKLSWIAVAFALFVVFTIESVVMYFVDIVPHLFVSLQLLICCAIGIFLVLDSIKTQKQMQQALATDERQALLKIINKAAADMELETLLANITPMLLEATGSICGAFYAVNNTSDKLELKYSLGFNKNIFSEFDFSMGEGLVGAAAVTQEVRVIGDLPDDTVFIVRTFLGKVKPKSVMTVPVTSQDAPLGVYAFASIAPYSDNHLEVINLVRYYIGSAVNNCLTYEKIKRMSNELKFQNKLIQGLNEDLEQKISKRSMFLNGVIDNIAGHAIIVTDAEWQILLWNTGAQEKFGCVPSEAVGRSLEQVIIDQDEFRTVRACILKAEEKLHHKENGWHTDRNGERFYAETSCFARQSLKGDYLGTTTIIKALPDPSGE